VRLQTSYRSAPAIVHGALQMIASSTRLPDRLLEARGTGPEHIEIHECSTERAEAELVVHTIERTIGGSTFFSMDSGRVSSHEGDSLAFSDFAVLYRTEAQAACLVEAFQRSGMPFRKHSHSRLVEVPAVRELVRHLERVRQEAAEPLPLSVCLERALVLAREQAEVATGLDPSIEPLRALAERRADDPSGFLADLALGVDVDLWDPRAQGVSLLTLHASKGLEFPVVFIVGCEDGILPLHWKETGCDPAEERRLFFVGMTRARRRLCLTYARRRRWRGTVRSLGPSPFLKAIEERWKALEKHSVTRKREGSPFRQLTLFE
jgi:DNA helicase-2/ATP-dependent DNA helicase PcrA